MRGVQGHLVGKGIAEEFADGDVEGAGESFDGRDRGVADAAFELGDRGERLNIGLERQVFLRPAAIFAEADEVRGQRAQSGGVLHLIDAGVLTLKGLNLERLSSVRCRRMQSGNGTVVRWGDAVIETYEDGSGLVWAQVETLVPDRVLARGLGDGLAMFYGECSVTVLHCFVVVRVPDVLRESERILRQVVDQSARLAEFEYRKAVGVR